MPPSFGAHRIHSSDLRRKLHTCNDVSDLLFFLISKICMRASINLWALPRSSVCWFFMLSIISFLFHPRYRIPVHPKDEFRGTWNTRCPSLFLACTLTLVRCGRSSRPFIATWLLWKKISLPPCFNLSRTLTTSSTVHCSWVTHFGWCCTTSFLLWTVWKLTPHAGSLHCVDFSSSCLFLSVESLFPAMLYSHLRVGLSYYVLYSLGFWFSGKEVAQARAGHLRVNSTRLLTSRWVWYMRL